MLIYVIVLNWNGWKDTIECLESIFRLTSGNVGVVVCDNASSDGSLTHIKEWANGWMQAESANPQLSHLISPPVQKPIQFCEVTQEQVESGLKIPDARLTLVRNNGNLGFAGGNNVGLRLALADPESRYFWLLNNDTVVKPDTLAAMLQMMQAQPELGLCGSLNLSYYNPTEVQSEGGKSYSRWTARVRTPNPRTIDELKGSPASIDFVNGASMLASREFLETIGLMEETYFLYFEELDWAMRAKGKFKLGYAKDSLIFHKEGAAIGSNLDRMKRSLLSDMYLSRNRVLFTKRFFPWALPTVLAWTSLAAAYRLLRGDLKRAAAMLSFMIQGLRPLPSKARIK